MVDFEIRNRMHESYAVKNIMYRKVKTILIQIIPYGVIIVWRRIRKISAIGMPFLLACKVAINKDTWADFNALGFSLLINSGIKQGGVIVDVGANRGQWTVRAHQFLSPSALHCFEPFPDTYSILKDRLSDLSEVIVYNVALSDETGFKDFYVTVSDLCSSLMQPLEEMKEYYGEVIENREVTKVNVVRLDDIELPEKIDLVKIDVQGAEISVINGALEILRKTKIVIIEANFKPHYQGGSTFFDIHKKLTSIGFFLHCYGSGLSLNREILWTDAVYLRR